jgi:hypothetical protein
MRSSRIAWAVLGAGQVLVGPGHLMAAVRIFDHQLSTSDMSFATGGIVT